MKKIKCAINISAMILISVILLNFFNLTELGDKLMKTKYIIVNSSSYNNTYTLKTKFQKTEDLQSYVNFYIKKVDKYLGLDVANYLKHNPITLSLTDEDKDNDYYNIYINKSDFCMGSREIEFKVLQRCLNINKIENTYFQYFLYLYMQNKIDRDLNEDNFTNNIHAYAATKYILSGDELDMLKYVGDYENQENNSYIITYIYLNYSFVEYLINEYGSQKIIQLNSSDDKSSYEKVYGKTLDDLKKEWINCVKNNETLVDMVKANENSDEFNEDEILKLFRRDKYFNSVEIKGKDILTIKEATEDINMAFDIIKYKYAGYEHFGGDKVFEEARKNALNTLQYFSKVKKNTLWYILVDNLSFIKDGHFSINGMLLRSGQSCYYSNEYVIKKENDDYYVDVSGSSKKILSINNKKLFEQYIKPSIDENGKKIYAFYTTDTSGYGNKKIDIKLENSSYMQNLVVNLEEDVLLYASGNMMFDKKVDGNTEIIKLSNMKNTDQDINRINWLNSAQDAKKYENLIIDLRNNIGGKPEFSDYWIEGFIGKLPIRENSFFRITEFERVLCYIMNLNNNYIYMNQYSVFNTIMYDGLDNMIDDNLKSINIEYNQHPKTIKNKNNIYVLINKNTASAAEYIVEALNNVENVTIVGTNSTGAIISSNSGECYLPNSNLSMNCGNYFHDINDENYSELNGFEPDLWVNSKDSLDRLLKYCQNKDKNAKNDK